MLSICVFGEIKKMFLFNISIMLNKLRIQCYCVGIITSFQFFSNLLCLSYLKKGRRGPVGLFINSPSHGAKVRGFETQSFLFFFESREFKFSNGLSFGNLLSLFVGPTTHADVVLSLGTSLPLELTCLSLDVRCMLK